MYRDKAGISVLGNNEPEEEQQEVKNIKDKLQQERLDWLIIESSVNIYKMYEDDFEHVSQQKQTAAVGIHPLMTPSLLAKKQVAPASNHSSQMSLVPFRWWQLIGEWRGKQ